MALPLSNSFEGGSDETTITTGNSGGASGNAWSSVYFGAGSLVYDSALAASGAFSARMTVATPQDAIQLRWEPADFGTVTDHYGRIYIYRTANPSFPSTLFNFFNITPTLCASMVISSVGEISIRDSVGTQDEASTGITLNAWTRIEWHLTNHASAGAFECKFYDAHSTSRSRLSR